MDVYGVNTARAPLGEWIRDVETTLAVDPPADLLGGIVEAALTNDGQVRALLSPSTAERLSDDFLLETSVAEARTQNRLKVRVADSDLDDRLLLAEVTARVVVPVGDSVGVFKMDEADLVSALQEKYEARWDTGERVSTRAPPRSTLFETAEARLSQRFVEEFDATLDGSETLDWYGTPTPVETALVVAGRANEHLYDVSRWGEDASFASRSSLSRAKNDLENRGLIDIQHDPQERGRPRQRLLVGDERLADADPDEMVEVLRSLLQSED